MKKKDRLHISSAGDNLRLTGFYPSISPPQSRLLWIKDLLDGENRANRTHYRSKP